MLNVILTASVSFMITFFAIPVIMKIAEQKKLYDLPDSRKLHTKPIASLGGIGIFGGFFLAALLSFPAGLLSEFQYVFASAIIIFFLGIKDDIIVLTAYKKFLGQVLAASILVHLGDIRIASMHGLFGIYELPEVFSLLFSYITIIVIVNAFNLIDGVDGLAATLGLLALSIFGIYFFSVDLLAYSLLSFSMAGSLAAFLFFNFNPAKIFMGDSGSLLIGMVNAVLAIKFISVADSAAIALPIESAVAVGFSILMVPLADTLRVFSIRIINGRSPFSPDRNHIHHLLLDRGLSHKYVTLCCLLLNLMFISIAYFGRAMGSTYLLLTMGTIALLMLGALVYFKKPAQAPVIVAKTFQPVKEVKMSSTTKVVSINTEVAVVEN